MRVPHKTQIRRHIAAMMKTKVDTGGRVYESQPSPRFLGQLPCVCVFYGTEAVEITKGDKSNVREYRKDLRVIVDILAEESIRQGDPEENTSCEDFLDIQGERVETALEEDPYLVISEEGDDLSQGAVLLSSEPYKVAEDADRRVMAQRLTYSVPYLRETSATNKLADFLYYGTEIPEYPLYGAEGEVRNES